LNPLVQIQQLKLDIAEAHFERFQFERSSHAVCPD
jgi:hypothetical protein